MAGEQTVKDVYTPIQVGVNASVGLGSITMLGGFLCATAGSISVTDSDGNTVVPLTALAAGTFTPLPFKCNKGTIVASLGASGVIGVA